MPIKGKMLHIIYIYRVLFALWLVAMLAGCRTDDQIVYMEDENTGVSSSPGTLVGMYLLNEGNMGSNKCTLDYLDLSSPDSTIHYLRNIYAERNPNEVKELGDVGNDAKIYGQRLWLVINCSNKVEVLHSADATKIGKIDIPNCRSLAFHDGYAYVSSFVGPVAVGGDSPLGMVYKVDTLTLQKTDSLTVGYQPEEMAVSGDFLYVANSGGYIPPRYDNRVSIIDLRTFTLKEHVEVGINLQLIRTDSHGQLWVSSRGNNRDKASCLYWLLPAADGSLTVGGCIDRAVSGMSIAGDSLYFYGADFNALTYDVTEAQGIVNTATHQIVSESLSADAEMAAISQPYGIIVNPDGRDFYMMDAKNYVSSGVLLHFLADGTFDYKVRTGDIPGHAVFLYK